MANAVVALPAGRVGDRVERVRAAVLRLRPLVSWMDQWDAVAAAGLLLLLVGLWTWVGFGPACTVVGGLLLLLAVAGARQSGWPDDARRERGG